MCIGKWDKYNYPYSRNFIGCASRAVAFDCGMFVYDLWFLFVSWHGMYIDVTGPMLCNVTLWMQINTHTNTKVYELFPEVVFHTHSLMEILSLHVPLILAVDWVMLQNAMWSKLVVNFDPLGINTIKWFINENLAHMECVNKRCSHVDYFFGKVSVIISVCVTKNWKLALIRAHVSSYF